MKTFVTIVIRAIYIACAKYYESRSLDFGIRVDHMFWDWQSVFRIFTSLPNGVPTDLCWPLHRNLGKVWNSEFPNTRTFTLLINEWIRRPCCKALPQIYALEYSCRFTHFSSLSQCLITFVEDSHLLSVPSRWPSWVRVLILKRGLEFSFG